jgi:quercetin dioxygenase-like cupin family protein
MKTTILTLADGTIKVNPVTDPEWTDVDEHGSERGLANQAADLHQFANATVLVHRIPAGRHFPDHTSPDRFSVAHVVTGKGTLTLPGDQRIPFTAPETFIFEPGTLHGWHDITEDTLLAICNVDVDNSGR